jgi:hypothetical protein
MGLKGYRLWVMGQLDSDVPSPTAAVPDRAVAVHVAFLKLQTLKPGFALHSLEGWVTWRFRRFQAMGHQLDSTCTAPHRAVRHHRVVAAQVDPFESKL